MKKEYSPSVPLPPQARRYRGERVGALVEQLAKPLFKQHGFAETKLIMEWPAIVGKELAQVSSPTKLQYTGEGRQRGCLHLRVAPGWATEIQHSMPQILDRITLFLGYPAVERIQIMQSVIPAKQSAEVPDSVEPVTHSEESVDEVLARLKQMVETK